jgi:phospholipid/cholesterol/gamma-HCH transport system permease protein
MFTEYSFHIKLLLGTDSTIPSFAMIMIAREIAPNIAAMLIISRMGASSTAEIGVMKTTEQLDAYRLLGIKSIDLIVAPQVLAASLTTFLLTLISLFSVTVGGWIACTWILNFTTGTYFQNLFLFTRFSDIVFGLSKSFLYGASIPIICATFGFRCEHGAEGVGMATTNAVVASTVWIILLGFLCTMVFSLLQ